MPATTREYLQEILDLCYKNTLFNQIKVYHKNVTVLNVFPTNTANVSIDSTLNHFVAAGGMSDLLQGGGIKFIASPTLTEPIWEVISPDTYYYITNVMGRGGCTHFTIGYSPNHADIIDLPTDNTPIQINATGYMILESIPNWLKIGTPVCFFNKPTGTGIQPIGVSADTLYYVREILAGNKISIAETTDGVLHTLGGGGDIALYQNSTFIEGTGGNERVTLYIETFNKIPGFYGKFGIDALGSLNNILQDPYYGPFIGTNLSQNDAQTEIYTSGMNFVNEDASMSDNIKTVAEVIADEQITVKDYKGSLWNFKFDTSSTSVINFKNMTLTYAEIPTFDVYTTTSEYFNPDYPALPHYNLYFEFGNKDKKGELLYKKDIGGTFLLQSVPQYVVKLENANARGSATILGTAPNETIVIDGVYGGSLATGFGYKLVEGSQISFTNPNDSTLAVPEAGLSYNTRYFIRDISGCSFRVSTTPNGSTLNLPYSNFSFYGTIYRTDQFAASVTYNNSQDNLNTSAKSNINFFKKNKEIIFKSNYFNFTTNKSYFIQDITYGSSTVNGTSTTSVIYFTLSDAINGKILQIQPNSSSVTIESITDADTWTIASTNWFRVNDRITFAGISGTTAQDLNSLDISSNVSYYIKEIIDENNFTISTTVGGPTKTIPQNINISSYVITVTRDTGTGEVLTSNPQANYNPYYNQIVDTIYGKEYAKIETTNTTYDFSINQLATPTENSKLLPIKIGDLTAVQHDKLFSDTTVNVTLDPDGSSSYDGKYVHSFEFSTSSLNSYIPSGVGNEIKIYDTVQKGYLLPVGFLKDRWTFPSLEFSSICISDNFMENITVEYEISGETYENTEAQTVIGSRTEIRFSDQGNLMITITTDLGIYNYIIEANNKS